MADDTNQDSVFTKIINRELPATIHYEDSQFIVINSIDPVAPVHVLVIPKKPHKTLEDVPIDDDHFHARLLEVARLVAKKLNISENYKLFMNVGTTVQAVHHIHLHVTGGWESSVTRDEIDAAAKALHTDGLK